MESGDRTLLNRGRQNKCVLEEGHEKILVVVTFRLRFVLTPWLREFHAASASCHSLQRHGDRDLSHRGYVLQRHGKRVGRLRRSGPQLLWDGALYQHRLAGGAA